ncbi:outer membrane receptor for ferrienterochelin and colicins [Reichenbachiella agariperforans]|uniref:Outer membrane receptor for ferrienterochelin and colicins n=1 Tax=Reichenbachiella agariperforans TaxID=156994 RepID=A0A1M6NSK6_REIAG|nr:TonB-dependent receptor plug domain-containing protein [Reichenbachiella agariperforans]SHJ98664.1 outer membrane receptor for ferrienterochelin and colicins [Reichenbachiella agariperforans]
MQAKLIYIFALACALLTLLFGETFGQEKSLRFLSSDNEPIVGVAVLLYPHGESKAIQRVSDLDGHVRLGSVAYPLTIETQHISFDPLSQRLDQSDNHTLYLTERSDLLEDVTITSATEQSSSLNTTLFVVDQMDSQSIQRLGGNDLSDVLNFNNNINVMPDPSTGRSTVNMFGLGGEYVKILIDNVPMVSDNGAGNNIDITQINLDQVERIEISEGAMGVLYGSNAVAGVINIVTKKGGDTRFSIQAAIQEETVGGEYNWSDEGRHIQRLTVKSHLGSKLHVTANANHNDFKGFKNDHQGVNYYGSDGVRGYEWNPKEQIHLGGQLHYSLSAKTILTYGYDYYHEELFIHDTILIGGVGIDGLPEYKAQDNRYVTDRQAHRLSINHRFDSMPMNLFFSYQAQSRSKEEYVYDLERQSKTSSGGLNLEQSSDYLYSKGTLKNILNQLSWLSITAGYEADYQTGYDAVASGAYSSDIAEQSLSNLDAFALATWTPTAAISITPGLRLNHNSAYNQHMIWSVSTLWRAPKQFSAQLVVGSAYKTPTYTQLFRYFVDANHDVTGNQDLNPEDGISVVLNLSKSSSLGELLLKNEIKGSYFDIHGKIGMAIITEENPDAPSSIQRSTYLNIDEYQTIGISTNHQLIYRALSAQIGASYIGARQFEQNENQNEDYVYTLSGTASLSYLLRPLETQFSVNFKYNGSSERYYQDDEGAYKVLMDPYSLMDMSIQKSFFDEAFRIKLGARNLLNVVQVNASGLPSASAHGGSSPSSMVFAYGRSYFINLSYTFKK